MVMRIQPGGQDMVVVVRCVLAILLFMPWLRPADASTCTPPPDGSSIATQGSPFGVVVSGDGCWMFLSTQAKQHGSIEVLHDAGGSYARARTIALQGPGLGETLSRDGSLLIVATGTGIEVFSVPVLERSTGDALLARVRLRARRQVGAVYVLTSEHDRLLFVSEERAGKIAVYDLAAWRSDGFKGDGDPKYIPARFGPVGLALAPDGRSLYATVEVAPPVTGSAPNCKPRVSPQRWHPYGYLMRIDVALADRQPRRSVTGIVQTGCNPVRVATSPHGKFLWVTERGSGQLLQLPSDVFGRDAKVVHARTFDVHGEPVGVVVRPDGHQVWVTLSDRFAKATQAADRDHQLVGVMGTGGLGLGAPLHLVSEPASGFPRELAFLPDGRTLAVALFRAKRIEFIATPP